MTKRKTKARKRTGAARRVAPPKSAPPPGAARTGKRRAFSTIDRLPERLRESVQSMLTDAGCEYTDIQRYVLIETTPPRLRAQVDAMVAPAFDAPAPGNGSAPASGRGATRRGAKKTSRTNRAEHRTTLRQRALTDAHAWCVTSLREGETPPTLLSDDALSKRFRHVAQLIGQIERELHLYERITERVGDKSPLGIGQAVGAVLLSRLLKIVNESKDKDLLSKAPKLLAASGTFYRAMVSAEKQRNERRAAVKTAIERVREQQRRVLSRRPRILEELDKALDEIEREETR